VIARSQHLKSQSKSKDSTHAQDWRDGRWYINGIFLEKKNLIHTILPLSNLQKKKTLSISLNTAPLWTLSSLAQWAVVHHRAGAPKLHQIFKKNTPLKSLFSPNPVYEVFFQKKCIKPTRSTNQNTKQQKATFSFLFFNSFCLCFVSFSSVSLTLNWFGLNDWMNFEVRPVLASLSLVLCMPFGFVCLDLEFEKNRERVVIMDFRFLFCGFWARLVSELWFLRMNLVVGLCWIRKGWLLLRFWAFDCVIASKPWRKLRF